mgnify:CR=1 FL=1
MACNTVAPSEASIGDGSGLEVLQVPLVPSPMDESAGSGLEGLITPAALLAAQAGDEQDTLLALLALRLRDVHGLREAVEHDDQPHILAQEQLEEILEAASRL